MRDVVFGGQEGDGAGEDEVDVFGGLAFGVDGGLGGEGEGLEGVLDQGEEVRGGGGKGKEGQEDLAGGEDGEDPGDGREVFSNQIFIHFIILSTIL